MSLVRFSPSSFSHRFFDGDFFDRENRNYPKTNTSLPSVNIKENDDEFTVEMAAPGFEKKDFNIEVRNNLMTISSEKKEIAETKEREFFTKREFSYQSFSRSFTLPQAADTEKVNATYDKGILNVIIPKREESKSKTPHRIEVN
ncbi:MAG: Hsp20/alpha crystallin family protein [Paludibacteraceae bacterium]